MQVFLSLLFVLHVADPRGEVPEADVGVLRLREHTQLTRDERNTPARKNMHAQGIPVECFVPI